MTCEFSNNINHDRRYVSSWSRKCFNFLLKIWFKRESLLGSFDLGELLTFTRSRVGAVAHYAVLWAVLCKYKKWPFSAPNRIKNLEPINTVIGSTDYVIELTRCLKFGQDRSSGCVSPYGWSCRLPLIFFLKFGSRALAQPTPGTRPPHAIHQSMRFGSRMCLFGVSTLRNYIWGSYFPKLPFLAGNTDFQLKCWVE
jgi:hypothetical protein